MAPLPVILENNTGSAQKTFIIIIYKILTHSYKLRMQTQLLFLKD